MAKKSRENAFFAIFKRVYGRFGVRYGIHRLSDDFCWVNPHFLKFWARSDKNQQKRFFKHLNLCNKRWLRPTIFHSLPGIYVKFWYFSLFFLKKFFGFLLPKTVKKIFYVHKILMFFTFCPNIFFHFFFIKRWEAKKFGLPTIFFFAFHL